MSITKQICGLVLRSLVLCGGLFCPLLAHELNHQGNIRHIVEFDSEFQNINRVLTAGYPDSLGLFAFWGRQEPETVLVNDKVCQKANFFALDVEDEYLYDVNADLHVEFEFAASQIKNLLLAYDKHGSNQQLVSLELKPVANGLYKAEAVLSGARLINRGMAKTDLAISSLETMDSQTALDDSRFILCDVKVRAVQKQSNSGTQKAPYFVSFHVENSDEFTPARFALYNEAGTLMLPQSGQLSLPFYEQQKSIFSVRSGVQNEVYWPVANRDFMYTSSTVEFQLEPGDYTLVASKGIEYPLIKKALRVGLGTDKKQRIEFTRLFPGFHDAWISGDVHIHMNREVSDNPVILDMMRAEGLGIANMLSVTNLGATLYSQPQWHKGGYVNTYDVALVPGVESPRTAFRGHVISLNIPQVLGLGDDYFLYHQFLEKYQHQGGISGYAHIGSEEFNGSWGLALDMPFGLVDFAEVMQNAQLRTDIWYEHLNIGHRLAPAAGSDFPYFDQPGAVRTYVNIEADQKVPDAWFDGLKQGRVYVTNGPLIEVALDGHLPGAALNIEQNMSLSLSVNVDPALDTLDKIELVHCGNVIKTIDPDSEHTFEQTLSLKDLSQGWLALRVTGRGFSHAHTGPFYLQGGSQQHWCEREAASSTRSILEKLSLFENARPELSRELEYWHAHGLEKQFEKSRESLKKRIELARQYYLSRMQRYTQ